MTNLADATQATMALVERHAAHNYSPLPVVAASAEGAWIADIDGLRYLDWLAAYSAVNLGHRNPASTATAHAQVDTVTLLNGPCMPTDSGRWAPRLPSCAAKTWCCQ